MYKKALTFVAFASIFSVAFAQPNARTNFDENPDNYCARVEKSAAVKEFVQRVKMVSTNNANSTSMSNLFSLVLDNNNERLKKGMVARLTAIVKSDYSRSNRIDTLAANDFIFKLSSIVNDCAKKNVNNDLFLFFSGQPLDKRSVESQILNIKQNNGGIDGYKSNNGPKFFRGVEIDSRWASYFIFFFTDTDSVALETLGESSNLIANTIKDVKDNAAARTAQADQDAYGGVRNLYSIAQSKEISSSFNKCISDEKTYQSSITNDLIRDLPKATTVSQRDEYKSAIEFRTQRIQEISIGMCLYRLNVALMTLDSPQLHPDLIATLALSNKERSKQNLNQLYTPNGLNQAAQSLSASAKTFHEKQNNEVKSLYGSIFANYVTPIINGKLNSK